MRRVESEVGTRVVASTGIYLHNTEAEGKENREGEREGELQILWKVPKSPRRAAATAVHRKTRIWKCFTAVKPVPLPALPPSTHSNIILLPTRISNSLLNNLAEFSRVHFVVVVKTVFYKFHKMLASSRETRPGFNAGERKKITSWSGSRVADGDSLFFFV